MTRIDLSRHNKAAAWILWIAFTIILSLVIRKDIEKHSVVTEDYRAASLNWLHGEPIYQLDNIHGFLYTPSSAALTVPFALLPGTVHEFVWRWISIAILTLATFRLAGTMGRKFGGRHFLGLTLVVLPICAGSARAGQMNLILAAALAFAAVDVAEERWWPATIWFAVALALKPQALVFILLTGAFVPAMRWRALLAIVVALLIPFILQRPDYVWSQYHLYGQKLVFTGQPGAVGVRYNDLFGLFSAVGIELTEHSRWIIRMLGVPLAMLLALLAVRRKQVVPVSIALLAISSCYLMFFNPHTEGGSYIIAGMPLGVYVCWALETKRPMWQVGILIAIALGWTLSYEISKEIWLLVRRMGVPTAEEFSNSTGPFWFSPLLCVFFTGVLAYFILEKRREGEALRSGQF